VKAVGPGCLLLLAVILLALPGILSSYELVLATRILIFALLAMSLDLLVGYSGLSSLGHAAFFGIAGYAVGLLSKDVTANLAVTLPAAVLVSSALAAMFGALVLRSKGVYFMMLTLALAQVVWGIGFQWRSLTGRRWTPRHSAAVHWRAATWRFEELLPVHTHRLRHLCISAGARRPFAVRPDFEGDS